MHESQLDRRENAPEPPISVSHFVHTLAAYKSAIVMALVAVVITYIIIGAFIYLRGPAQRITAQPFRLDFKGAGEGKFPNATPFNVADIVSGPILTKVYQDNHLEDYLSAGEFSRSVFVLESNPDYDALAAEYQAKLADSRITPVDRERLQQEFELKRKSIAKNEYAIHFIRQSGATKVPETIARKVLLDVLNDWADFAVNQQHVLAYQISVYSPEIIVPTSLEKNDIVVGTDVLRTKANRVIANVEQIERLPGATLVRTPSGHISLEEVRMGLEDVVRFRLDPLLTIAVHSPALSASRTATIRFLGSQLAYDQRKLESAQRMADAARESLIVYEQPNVAQPSALESRSPRTDGEQQKNNEALMPQLSDSFLTELMTLTSRASDAQYRQTLVDAYRKAVSETIPLKQAVAYDTQILSEVQKPLDSSAYLDASAARAQIEQGRAEIGQLIGKMNELFQIVSRNMTPSAQLFTLTGPPSAGTLRAVSLQRLGLYGLLVVLISLPLIIVLCLLHNRIREEEAAENTHSQRQPMPAERN